MVRMSSVCLCGGRHNGNDRNFNVITIGGVLRYNDEVKGCALAI